MMIIANDLAKLTELRVMMRQILMDRVRSSAILLTIITNFRIARSKPG